MKFERQRKATRGSVEPILKFADRGEATAKIRDLTCPIDLLPTGYYGAVTARVGPGSTVYIAGVGPIGMAAAEASGLLGASASEFAVQRDGGVRL